MGAWGINAFQSDEGLDFLSNIIKKDKTKDSIEKALEGVICVGAFCSETEALAEIIANAYGKMNSDVDELELSAAMERVKYLESDKAYFENILAKLHYALTIINRLNSVLWKEELLEERKQYITKLSSAIEQVVNEVKKDGTNN